LEINIFISRVIYLTPARNSGNKNLLFFIRTKTALERERFVVIRASEAVRENRSAPTNFSVSHFNVFGGDDLEESSLKLWR
jgi:hypothetical protein